LLGSKLTLSSGARKHTSKGARPTEESEGFLSLLDKREDQKPLPPSARE